MGYGGCGVCGAPVNWRELLRAPWEGQARDEGWTRFAPMNAGTVQTALDTGATYEKRKATRAPRVESDVLVPFFQSAITGVVGGVVVGMGAGLVGEGVRSFLWAGMGAGAAWGLGWLVLLGEHRRGLWEVERLVGRRERGGGGREGEVGKRPDVRVEVTERTDKGRLLRMRWVDIPGVRDDELTAVAKAVDGGATFSRRGLGDVLSEEKYGVLKGAMLGGDLLVHKGKGDSSGVELTRGGKAFLRAWLRVWGGEDSDGR